MTHSNICSAHPAIVFLILDLEVPNMKCTRCYGVTPHNFEKNPELILMQSTIYGWE